MKYTLVFLLLVIFLVFCHPPRPACNFIGIARDVDFVPILWSGTSQTQVSTELGYVVLPGQKNEIHIGDSLFICYDREWGQRVRINGIYYPIVDKYIRITY